MEVAAAREEARNLARSLATAEAQVAALRGDAGRSAAVEAETVGLRVEVDRLTRDMARQRDETAAAERRADGVAREATNLRESLRVTSDEADAAADRAKVCPITCFSCCLMLCWDVRDLAVSLPPFKRWRKYVPAA